MRFFPGPKSSIRQEPSVFSIFVSTSFIVFTKYRDFARICCVLAKNLTKFGLPFKKFHKRTDTNQNSTNFAQRNQMYWNKRKGLGNPFGGNWNALEEVKFRTSLKKPNKETSVAMWWQRELGTLLGGAIGWNPFWRSKFLSQKLKDST